MYEIDIYKKIENAIVNVLDYQIPVTQLTKNGHLSFMCFDCLLDFTSTPHNVSSRLSVRIYLHPFRTLLCLLITVDGSPLSYEPANGERAKATINGYGSPRSDKAYQESVRRRLLCTHYRYK